MNPLLIAALIVAAVLIILCCTYLILMKPNKKRGGLEKYKSVKFAHRGLHGEGVAENSLTAFRRAVEAGYGIELDVHTVKCGTAVVFHDATLNRMVGEDARLRDFTAEELHEKKLNGTDDYIPTFREVLETVDGKVPLLVELKQDDGEVGVAKAVAELLREYKGDFIVESFNPFTLRDFAREMPEVRRGILSQHFTASSNKFKAPRYHLLQHLLLNRVCKPDFIAYNHAHGNYWPLKLIKKLYGVPTFAWTTRSQEQEDRAYRIGFDSVIFELYVPKES